MADATPKLVSIRSQSQSYRHRVWLCNHSGPHRLTYCAVIGSQEVLFHFSSRTSLLSPSSATLSKSNTIDGSFAPHRFLRERLRAETYEH